MKRLVLFLGLVGGLADSAEAQELNCNVKVLAPNLQATDPKVFETLEQSISEFLNNRRWTNDQFLPKERIDCSMLISITQEISSDRFAAQVTIQSSRPVYHSSYNSPLLYLVDKDFQFQYAQYQPLEYVENQFTSSLVAFLAYYAYVIIGLDYDSFSPKGGNPYFQRASQIVAMAQSANAAGPGWKSFEGTRNRFWLINNLTNPKLDYIHDMLYSYHRQGLDQMYEQTDKGRKAILDALTRFAKIRDDEPTAMFTQVFCQTKGEELVNIFSKGLPQEKSQAVQLLVSLDPSNAARYQQIMKAN
ncbi:MAG: DUF4835 family protein [Chitinophagales bacterium]|nr:DUF4835 family protein [Chitinophagales bacterium]MDW8392923.1 DUF4835 family protein [Chitinophagales bacterium]